MSNSILGKGKYVENMSHFIKWLKICPILLSGWKYVPFYY